MRGVSCRRLAAAASRAVQLSAAILLGYSVVATSGCASVGDTVPLVVSLPDLPSPWRQAWGPCGYFVTWRSHYGVGGNLRVPPTGVATERPVFSVPRGAAIAVLAWPVWETGGPGFEPGESLRPAGVVVEARLPGFRTSLAADLAWDSAPVAQVLLTAAGLGADIQGFNHGRLQDEIRSTAPDDPWTIDVQRLVRAVCERSMRVTYVRLEDTVAADLDVPEGEWFSPSPFQSSVSGGEQSLNLREGVTPYYDAHGRRLRVDLDDRGDGRIAISPPG
jgi:hypothetical protein